MMSLVKVALSELYLFGQHAHGHELGSRQNQKINQLSTLKLRYSMLQAYFIFMLILRTL